MEESAISAGAGDAVGGEVLLSRHGPVALVTLNRPGIGNAIDRALARRLLDVALTCAGDETIRCVVLTGAGRMFCAGGDVNAFATAGNAMPGLVAELTAFLNATISRLMRMSKPLVTAINGPAAGAGLGLALMGDVALAGSGSSFSTAYRGIGLTPDGGATWMLPRLVGLRRAQEIALTDRRLSAAEAAEIGLVTRVVDGEALLEKALETAQHLAASAIGALAGTRELLHASHGASLEGHLEMEAGMIARAAATDDARRLIAEFISRKSTATR